MTQSGNTNVYVQAPPTNGLGLAGFIVSLVGWVMSCGVLCPIGFVMSCIAVFRQPRGFAVAGIIIGLMGTIMGVVVLFIGFVPVLMMLGIMAAVTAVGAALPTYNAISTADHRVHDAYVQHGELPSDASGNALVNGLNDQWGHNVRYHQLGPTQYEIRSEGADGVMGTSDDVVSTMQASEVPGGSTTETAPPTPGPEAPVER